MTKSSFHSSGDDFRNEEGARLRAADMASIVADADSTLFSSVEELYLLGCNTGRRYQFGLWMAAYENLHFGLGFRGSAPLDTASFLKNVFHLRLTGSNDLHAYDAIAKQLQYAADFFASGEFALTAPSVAESKAAVDATRPACVDAVLFPQRAAYVDPETDTQSGPCRQYYDSVLDYVSALALELGGFDNVPLDLRMSLAEVFAWIEYRTQRELRIREWAPELATLLTQLPADKRARLPEVWRRALLREDVVSAITRLNVSVTREQIRTLIDVVGPGEWYPKETIECRLNALIGRGAYLNADI